MGVFETAVFFLSCYLVIVFFKRWYQPLLKAWPRERNRPAKTILACLPVLFLVLIFFILKFLASFDVVNSVFFIIFYILLGYAWMYGSLMLMSLCFDINWTNDSVYLNNKAALAAVIGEFFSSAFIYAGANVGDGPGWWCVIFAGLLGIAAWIILGFVIHYCTGIFERITVDRDLGCGIRFMVYLLASGAILGYACSGDWTSFKMTVVEFGAGWPVLPLTAVYICIEKLIQYNEKEKTGVSP